MPVRFLRVRPPVIGLLIALSLCAPGAALGSTDAISDSSSPLYESSEWPTDSPCRSALIGASAKTMFFNIFKKEIEFNLDGEFLKASDLNEGQFSEAKIATNSNFLLYTLEAADHIFIFLAVPNKIFKGYKTSIYRFELATRNFYHPNYGQWHWISMSDKYYGSKHKLLTKVLSQARFVAAKDDAWSTKLELSNGAIYVNSRGSAYDHELVVTKFIPPIASEQMKKLELKRSAEDDRVKNSRGDGSVPLEKILSSFLGDSNHG